MAQIIPANQPLPPRQRRISVTDLEQFRLCITTDYASIDELRDKLLGHPKPPTMQMQVGTAWHKYLETRRPNGYLWEVNTPTLWDGLQGGCFEVQVERENLAGRLDFIRGAEITDFKAQFGGGPPDPSRYEKSLQWRCYLWMTGASSMTYRCWSMDMPDDQLVVRIRGELSMTYQPYPAMENDIREWVAKFEEWRETIC